MNSSLKIAKMRRLIQPCILAISGCALSIMPSSNVSAQSNDFCEAVTAIADDATNKFRNVMGNTLRSVSGGSAWECGIKVPGTIASRLVFSMGLFYEGAVLQSNAKQDVQGTYDQYKILLDSCFLPRGYTLLQTPNFYPGLSGYKKLVYMPSATTDMPVEQLPAHITMEATYNKEIGQYTVVLYIFEH